MSQKYDRKILAFFLADLGEELGRPPKPSDLKKGMPSRSTFARHFKDWAEALEYAGFVDDPREATEEPILLQPEVKIINLLNAPAIIVGPDGESEIFPSIGTAKIVRCMPKIPAAARVLAPHLVGLTVKSFRLKYIGVEYQDGTLRNLPSYQNGVFYIVSESVARNVYRFGRTTIDLLFPKAQDLYYQNGIVYIGSLQMVYTNKMPFESN